MIQSVSKKHLLNRPPAVHVVSTKAGIICHSKNLPHYNGQETKAENT